MARLRPIFIAALACIPVAAHAGPVLPTSPSAALHLGQKALDIIGQVAAAQLPTSLQLPNYQAPLLSCLGNQVSVTASNMTLALQPDSINFQPADGALGVSAVVDVSGGAHVLLTNGNACLSDIECDVSFSIEQLAPTASISIAIQNSVPSVALDSFNATIPAGGIQVSFANCALDLIPQSVTDALAQELFKVAQGPIQSELQAKVPPLVQQQLATMLTQSGSVSGYDYTAAITNLAMTANGIDAYAELGVAYDGAAASCLAPGAVAQVATTGPASAIALPSGPTSQVVLGVTTDLLSSALQAAWSSGVMCLDDSQVAALGFDPSSLASLVPGIPSGMTMHFSMSLDQPPVLEDDGMGGLTMSVKGAELLLAFTTPGQPDTGIAVVTDFNASVKPAVDAASGSVYATLTDMAMQRLDIDAGASGTQLKLDPERLTVLVHDLVIPMANARLATMPVMPASFGADGIYAWLDTLLVANNSVFVGIEPFLPGPAGSDSTPPTTLLKTTPGPLVRAGAAQFTLDGTDDQTPTQLLQYEWQVDGGPVTQSGFQRVIAAPVTTSGMHTFQARAIDLAGNHASNWASYSFELDAVPPTLSILSQPAVTARTPSAEIRITGTDDQTPTDQLSFGYRVSTRKPGGDLTVVTNVGPTPFTNGQGNITVDNLKSGNTYQVTVMIYDQAGNVTSSSIGFGAADVGGCSMSGTQAGGSPLGFVLLAAVLFLVRRRALRTQPISR